MCLGDAGYMLVSAEQSPASREQIACKEGDKQEKSQDERAQTGKETVR